KVERVHLNNTGKLLDLLVEGVDVLIMPIKGKRLKYRIVGTRVEGDEFTLIDTNLQERMFLKAHSMGLLPFLKDYVFVKRNVRIEGEVFDFLFKGNGRGLLVELKSAVYYFPNDKSARYPDTITIRGRKQLEKLNKLEGIVVFVAGHPYAEVFKPSHKDPKIPGILKDLKGKTYAIKMALKRNGDVLFLDGSLEVEV
ncbi:MAG: DNA/RNA nuclease SfsA, partial [candidate division WOR-3 bacterium]